MPRKAKDYSKALVYKLCCLDPNVKEIYVGSSTNFVERKKYHKNDCNIPNGKQYNLKVYQHIREFGGWSNWEMVLIEFYPCNNILELGKREDFWKQELQSSLNSIAPPMYGTRQEWYQDNKEKVKNKNEKWREANKEQILEKYKNKYQANKEKIIEKVKEYREKNKEKIEEKKKQKHTCECGKVYTHNHRARHFRTKVHQKHLAEKSR